MKKIAIVILFMALNYSLMSQPPFFSWRRPATGENKGSNYITSVKDQGEQGPCGIFAAVAAVEALSHIYYNKPFPTGSDGINLSEAELYSGCSGYGRFETAASVENSLSYANLNGFIDENCFTYPNSSSYFRTDCNNICSLPNYEVKIPGYEQLFLSSDQALKRAIIDFGPIIVRAQNISSVLHNISSTISHSFLIIGWSSSGWHIKDSWPGDSYINFVNFNVFNPTYNSKFWRSMYENNNQFISCTGSGCNPVFSGRSYTDNDGDGFYYWGIGPKPSGCPGPCKMDHNDENPLIICLDNNYQPVNTPAVSGPDLACTSGCTFTLNNLPSGFSATWSLSHPGLFNSPTSGSGTTATVYPKSQYSGDECSITFTISDGCGNAKYSKIFSINGPADSDIDIHVVPSNAPAPIRISGVWLLCPNSSYYIYCNNTSDCSLSNFQWNIPSGWTKYEQNSNYIRINTNSTPYGTVNVNANTCCGTNHMIISQNFSQGGACSFILVYPNPAENEFNIEFTEKFDMKTVDESTTIEVFDSGFSRKYKVDKIEKLQKIKTTDWKEGIYYIVFSYKGQKYYEKISVKK